MGDMKAELQAIRHESQARRLENRKRAPTLLRAAGVTFTSHNNGAHLIVAEEWNLWPGTGRWAHRGPPLADGRGVVELINRIKRNL